MPTTTTDFKWELWVPSASVEEKKQSKRNSRWLKLASFKHRHSKLVGYFGKIAAVLLEGGL